MSELVAPAAAQPAGADFRVLRGVGPAVERRLHEAGIVSYEQLAARSPAELAEILAGLVGMTPERIRQHDWAGQCARLAAQPADGAAATPRMRYATFTVELLLDEAQHARRTRVTHVQSGSEQSWAGWDSARLAELIAEVAGLQPEAPAPAPAIPEPAAPAPVVVPATPIAESAAQPTLAFPPNVAAPPAPMLRLGRLEFLPRSAGDTGRLLRHDTPFDVGLTLELGADGAELAYQALVYARNLSQSASTIVAQAQGQLTAASSASLLLEGAPLPPGVYRTEAMVVVSVPGASGQVARRSAMLEGGLVQVY